MTRTAAFAALLGLITTTPALAEPHVWQVGEGFTIRATGLDLRTTDGREALLQRVDWAAARMCRNARPRVQRDRCAEATRADAIAAAPGAIREAAQLAMATRRETRLAAR